MEYERKCYEGNEPRILVSGDFIKKNKLTLKRTSKEIRYRILNDNGFDFTDVLVDFLDFADGKEFYKDEYVKQVESGKEKKPERIKIEEATQDFLDYLVFGWSKAEDKRCLSASRTISKLSNWMWVLGRDDIVDVLQDNELYNPYGAPALVKASVLLGITPPKSLVEFSKVKC